MIYSGFVSREVNFVCFWKKKLEIVKIYYGLVPTLHSSIFIKLQISMRRNKQKGSYIWRKTTDIHHRNHTMTQCKSVKGM